MSVAWGGPSMRSSEKQVLVFIGVILVIYMLWKAYSKKNSTAAAAQRAADAADEAMSTFSSVY